MRRRQRRWTRCFSLGAAMACLCPAAALAAEPDCVAQTLLDVAKIDKQIVLVGEPHGTKEIPAFVAGLVCSLVKSGRGVILAIEHVGDEQESLNRYLLSEGNAADQAALLKVKAWAQRRCQDGRTSRAMFELVESVRQLRHAGQRVAVLAMERNENLDVPATAEELTPLSSEDNILQSRGNDRAMADNLAFAAILYRRYTVVALSGYGHTSTSQGYAQDPQWKPMGLLVGEQVPTYVIGIETQGGSHWQAGVGGCKERPLRSGLLVSEGARTDAWVQLGAATASPPAWP